MSPAPMPSEPIRRALSKACRLDVIAFKPGNVSLWSAGHGMHARDFLVSARVAIPALGATGLAVGARIERAVEASWAAVGMNTNLGIVLLLAPLAAAAEIGGDLRAALCTVLNRLDRDDASACYRAIRHARPAGLGRVARDDVADEPGVSLLCAMQSASMRDRIAKQYSEAYAEVFELGVPLLIEYRRRWHSLAWATTACYLQWLQSAPDSHVERKWGRAQAEAVSGRAGALATAIKACENPRAVVPLLRAFDDDLKARGVNPGTSADLTVASVAVLLLRERSASQQ